MGAASVLVTLGAQGAMLLTAENAAEGGQLIHPSHVVRVVDTSGAGDCYIGSLAAFLSRGVR
jgi:ribokinase